VTRISSRSTTFHKIFPMIWLVGPGTVFALGVVHVLTHGVIDDAVTLIVPVFMGIAGFFLIGSRVWGLMDEVYDCTDYLLVKNHGREEAIPLTNIMNVSDAVFTQFPRVTLRLVEPCSFGREIAFSPATPFSLNPFSKSSFVDELIVRVDRARSKRVASRT